MICRKKINIIVILCALFGSYSFYVCDGLTPSESRGKLIYTKGVRASGVPIEAQMSGAKLNAKILACVNCHGAHGIGNPEGGVDPSPLEWSILTKPYSIEFKNGRKRTGYNVDLFKRAVGEGIDPSENSLDLIMPQYSLDKDDINDLIAYLKVIGRENPIGITENSIDIGIILPSKDKPAGRSEAVHKVIHAYIDLINSGGGIFNRKIRLYKLFLDNEVEKSDILIQEFLEQHELFTLVACDLEAISKHSIKQIENRRIPIIGALSGNPNKEDYFKNEFYYLLPGLNLEIKELSQFAKDNLAAGTENLVILYDSTSLLQSFDIAKITSQNPYQFNTQNIDIKNYSSLITQLKSKGIRHCIFLGSSENGLSFLRDAHNSKWYPNVLTSGKFVSEDWLKIPIEFHNKIFLSYPTWTTERKENSLSQYNEMASRYDLSKSYHNSQFTGLASIILFTEILKTTGRNVNRASFIEQLYDQGQFETGFISTLEYGPNRRIGSERVFIVKTDLKNKKLELVE
jgi:ABC-type branched-subunit amino acid transport system substrate-binding protein